MMRFAALVREAYANGFLIACDHDVKVRAAEADAPRAILSGGDSARANSSELTAVWTDLVKQISDPLIAFLRTRFMLNPNWTWRDEAIGSSMREIFEQAGIGERFRPSDAPPANAPVIDLRWNDERGTIDVVTTANGRRHEETITHKQAIDLRVKLDELLGRYGRPQ